MSQPADMLIKRTREGEWTSLSKGSSLTRAQLQRNTRCRHLALNAIVHFQYEKPIAALFSTFISVNVM
jgi:hypothetical protein